MSGANAVIAIEDAFRSVDEALAGARLPAETLPTRAALGRVLACEQRSGVDLPPFDKAAVDGYAIGGEAEQGQYRLVRTVAAGQAAPPALRPGETAKVMTGAPVPAGTLRVVMQEDAALSGEHVRLNARGATNFCPRGEDMRRGDVVLPAGTRLRALEVANLIGCGVTTVEVVRRPRVAIISTGDEIVDDPTRLAPGKIMDVNGPLLAGLCVANGLDVANQVWVPDIPEVLRGTVESALTAVDIVVLSGGVSEGEYDYVLDVFAQLGLRVHFSRLAAKPGKPTAFATRERKAVFGLPGNPVSVFLMFHLLVLRAASHLTGAPVPLRQLTLTLAGEFRRRRADRLEYVPAALTAAGRVEPLACHGSAHLLALTQADGFVIVPNGVTELAAGAAVDFVLLPGSGR